MAEDITQVNLGICSVTLNDVNLGFTKGGAELTYKGTWVKLAVDQQGITPVKKVFTGEEVSVKTNLSQLSHDNLVAACGGAGTKITDGTKHAVTFGREPGFEADSYVLSLHPEYMGASLENDVTIYKASGIADVASAFKLEDGTVIPVTFEGIADLTRADKDRLWRFGDATASVDLEAPTMTIVPVDEAVGVDKAITTTVQITFSKDMNPATIIAGNLTVIADVAKTLKDGVWSYISATKKAIFTPSTEWAGTTKYKVLVSTDVKSINGVSMAAWSVTDFTTAA